MRRLTQYFLRGLVILVPLGITGYVFYALFTWVDRLLPFAYPGPGFVIVLAVTLLIGYLASNFVTRRLFDWMEAGITRIPFVSVVYRSVRDITDAVVGDKPHFKQPVRVQIAPESNAYLIGFLTEEHTGLEGLDHHVAVYLPWSYNVGGHLVIVPPEQVHPVDASASQVMSFVMSGGLVGASLTPDRSDTP